MTTAKKKPAPKKVEEPIEWEEPEETVEELQAAWDAGEPGETVGPPEAVLTAYLVVYTAGYTIHNAKIWAESTERAILTVTALLGIHAAAVVGVVELAGSNL